MLVHATSVDISGLGVLILGDSGAGKSDLALRLIAEGALLVADDQTWVEAGDGYLRARAAHAIAGLIEQRGVGIIPAPMKRATRLRLAVLLSASPERMPEPRSWSLSDDRTPRIPMIEFCPWEPAAAAKLRSALGAVLRT